MNNDTTWITWISPIWRELADEDVQRDVIVYLNELRQTRDSIFMDILIELSKADFTGLIKSGAPPSEYVPEVEQIVNRLGRVSSITELQNMIWQVFTEMFGGTYDIESVLYQDVSRQLWQGWQTRGLVPGTTNN